MLELRFQDTTFERNDVEDMYDLLLGITATFELVVDDRVIFSEPMFTIAELRKSLDSWLSGPMLQREDFEFESMEAEERGLVWIRWCGSGWQVGSVWETYRESRVALDTEVRKAVERFISEVDLWAEQELHVILRNHL